MAADLVRSLQFSYTWLAALAADFIMSSKFQSSGDCAGSRLDQQLEFFVVRGGCASSPFDQGLEISVSWVLHSQATWWGV